MMHINVYNVYLIDIMHAKFGLGAQDKTRFYSLLKPRHWADWGRFSEDELVKAL